MGSQHPMMQRQESAGLHETRSGFGPNRAMRFFRRLRRYWFVLALVQGDNIAATAAEIRLDASYGVTLAGLPIGAISGSLEIDERRFRATAEGATSGVFRLVMNGHGEIVTSGVRSRGEALPSNYALTTVIRSREETVRVIFTDRSAAEVSIDPEPPPNGTLLPLTEAHRKKVVDPLTAALVSASDRAGQLGPEVCQRTVPVFDGRVRYDLKLAFKQIVNVTTPIGYHGAAVVCRVSFVPIAGHDPNRFLFKYLAEQRDMEVWFVPVAGAGVLVPYRVSIHTPLGLGVMEARRLEIEQPSTPTNAP
jgi:hypothetical protein